MFCIYYQFLETLDLIIEVLEKRQYCDCMDVNIINFP